MSGQTQPALSPAPGWVVAEMPPGYQTRRLEVERLLADLRAMEEIGRVLWATGDALRDAVGAVFAALKCDVETSVGAAGPVAAKLGDSRRLLFFVSGATGAVQKTHEELAHVFQLVQYSGADDRVVFLANNHPAAPPAERPDPLTPDALAVLQRMGVDVVTTATVFRLWRASLEDPQRARKALERLHAQDGGLFVLPAR